MKMNAELVNELRTANSWSQEELSIAAGLNLRTVQRIESEGSASLQSKKALASAFGIEASDLDYKEIVKIMKYEYKVLKFDVKGWFTRKVDSNDLESELNKYGSEGWEIESVENILTDPGCTKMLVAIMKRSLQ